LDIEEIIVLSPTLTVGIPPAISVVVLIHATLTSKVIIVGAAVQMVVAPQGIQKVIALMAIHVVNNPRSSTCIRTRSPFMVVDTG
jgi:hypothetical protein